MQKILVFTKNWLGDVIFEEPLVRTLKSRYPESEITCVTNPRCESILSANPNVDHVILFDDRERDKDIFSKFKLVLELRKKKFHKAFILHRSLSRAAIVFFAGIKERYGYDSKGRSFFLTKAIKEPTTSQHRVDYLMNILKEVGIERNEEAKYRFYFSDKDKVYVDKLLEQYRIHPNSYICINPGANWDKKRWPASYFAELIDKISEIADYNFIITGAEKDSSLAEAIMSKVKKAKPVIFCGNTDLTQLAALYSMSKFVVSADSGPSHIASGVGSPVVAIFGPTSFIETGPKGIGDVYIVANLPAGCSRPCFDEACDDNECMRTISAEVVFQEIMNRKLLA